MNINQINIPLPNLVSEVLTDGDFGAKNIKTTGKGEFGGTTAALAGVFGYHATIHGVYGLSDSGNGVYGFSSTQVGVYGGASSGNGVSGASWDGYGVYGESANEYSGYFNAGKGLYCNKNITLDADSGDGDLRFGQFQEASIGWHTGDYLHIDSPDTRFEGSVRTDDIIPQSGLLAIGGSLDLTDSPPILTLTNTGTVVGAGHDIGSIVFYGKTNVVDQPVAGIEAAAQEIWSASEAGTKLIFYGTEKDTLNKVYLMTLAHIGSEVAGVGFGNFVSPVVDIASEAHFNINSTSSINTGLRIEQGGRGDSKMSLKHTYDTVDHQYDFGIDRSTGYQLKLSRGIRVSTDTMVEWDTGGHMKIYDDLMIGSTSAPTEKLDVAGNIWINNDDQHLYIGLSQDIDMYYNAGDAYLKTNGDSASDLLIECGAEKTLELQNVVYEDLRTPLTSAKVPASAGPSWSQFKDDGSGSTGVYLWHFSASSENSLYFTIQFPHAVKQGDTVYPHIHWSPSTTDTGDVRWGLEYTWVDVNGTFGNTTIIGVTDAADGTVGKHQVVSFPSFTGKNISSIVVCRLFRETGHADDDFTGEAIALEFDVHYPVETMGSRTEWAK